ncbi:MAG TPA: D-amino-acid transaminase [Rhizomicrobium sp.]
MSKGWNGRAPSGRIAYVDGRYVPHGEAGVHIEDRGLQLGDGIYEVCGVSGGRLIDENEHLDRLERSVREIEIAMPMPRRALALVMHELVRRNALRDGLLYLQVTRGAIRRDHPIPKISPRPSLMMTARALAPAEFERRRHDGVTVIGRPDERWARCDIKTIQLLPNLLAKTAARRAGAYEAWLVDGEGFVTEGSSTTAWIVDGDGRVVTRPLSNAILPGVTRRVILEAAAQAQLAVQERSFTLAEASAAREAFISSATGVMPVTAIDGHPVGDGKPGPVTRRVQELYALTSAGRAAKTGT